VSDSNHNLDGQQNSRGLKAIAVGTISRVADKSSKRLPPDMERAVATFVRELVEREFQPNAAGKRKSQREIAEELGISQPILSQALTYDAAHPSPLGIGINGLLALRDYSGQTIDAILGLELPSRAVEARAELEKLLDSAEELGRIVTSLVQKPSANSKLGRALKEVERIRMRAAAERRAEERVRQVNALPGGRRRAAG
jgi:hypothetical protein